MSRIKNIEYNMLRVIEKEDPETGRRVESGVYFLIKKEYSVEDDGREVINIYYKPMLDIRVDSKTLFVSFSTYHCGFNKRPFGAAFDPALNIVTFAYRHTFGIEECFQGKGLGSYLLDSLIVWAKKQSLTAKVDIDISGFSGRDENYSKMISHFYKKRNVKRDVLVEEIKRCIGDKRSKTEEIDIETSFLVFEKTIDELTLREERLKSLCRDFSHDFHKQSRDFKAKEFLYRAGILLLSVITLVVIIIKSN